MDFYPKYLPEFDVVAQAEADERALTEGRATVSVIKRAGGDLKSVSYPSVKDKAAKVK